MAMHCGAIRRPGRVLQPRVPRREPPRNVVTAVSRGVRIPWLPSTKTRGVLLSIAIPAQTIMVPPLKLWTSCTFLSRLMSPGRLHTRTLLESGWIPNRDSSVKRTRPHSKFPQFLCARAHASLAARFPLVRGWHLSGRRDLRLVSCNLLMTVRVDTVTLWAFCSRFLSCSAVEVVALNAESCR